MDTEQTSSVVRGGRRILVAVLLSCMGTTAPVHAQDGMYARLQTTMGEIRCQLYFEQTPRTVANFISLVEGTRPWVDYTAGRPRTAPFYEGITFHRVVTNFMIQTGSRNGLGTDGPGYTFRDEFVPGLTHSNAGVVSMANSGTNTNGSQFFITVAPTPWLDNVHTVFGRVVSGLDVAVAISGVPAVGNRPVVPVVITNAVIERIGAAAAAFDPGEIMPGLPDVRHTAVAIGRTGDNRTWVYWPRQTNVSYLVFGNPALDGSGSWTLWVTGRYSGVYIDGIMTAYPREFFRATEIESHE
jgi:cyclophilin family peptidyl-prolyl cis-trans isomerase